MADFKEELLAALGVDHKTKKGTVTPELVRQGTQIVVPKTMSMEDAIKWLMIKKDEDERLIAVHAEFANAFPLDSLVCLFEAIKERYGWSKTSTHRDMFGKEHAAATMINIPIGANGETREVPFGQFSLPNVEGELGTNINWTGMPTLVIGGEIKQKGQEDFHAIVELTRKKIATSSIYRGKSVRVSWEWFRNGGAKGFHPIQNAPQYIDLANVSEDDLVFSEDIRRSIELGLFAPIEKASVCRKFGVPLKRGVLLEGIYGTGKTLTALVTARKANANNWTFIYLDSVYDLAQGLQFAANYEPAVLFVEDVDKCLADEDGDGRTVAMNAVMNLLDGLDTKQREIITVFTTNFVEKLDRAVMRPGRLDTVVHLEAPDARAAVKLVYQYGRELLAPIDDEVVGEALSGKIPAVIREVIERAKLAAIARAGNDEVVPPIETRDIVDMARLMDNHIRLIGEPTKKPEVKYEMTLHPHYFDRAVN